SSSLQITPHVDGSWELSEFDSSRVAFRSDSLPDFGTAYEIIVRTTARDKFGNQIPAGIPFQIYYPTVQSDECLSNGWNNGISPTI
ncbi:MAG: hypothetical protein O7D34_06080, partial [Ignavibacteria bacterium]|nr:hypothetical protein [Ignavibacteria bacterium]